MKEIKCTTLMLYGLFLFQVYAHLLANDTQEVLCYRRKQKTLGQPQNAYIQPDVMHVASRSHRHLAHSPSVYLRPPTPELSIQEQRIAALEKKLIYQRVMHDERCSESCCAAVHAPFFGCIACLGILSQNPECASRGLCYPYDMTMCAVGTLTIYIGIFSREFVLLDRIANLKKEQ